MRSIVVHRPRPDAKVRLICFHSGGSTSQQFKDWDFDRLEIVCVELPGRGRTVGRPFANNLVEVVAAAQSQLGEACLEKPFALFGDSVGSILAYHLTLESRVTLC